MLAIFGGCIFNTISVTASTIKSVKKAKQMTDESSSVQRRQSCDAANWQCEQPMNYTQHVRQ